jgi:tetratricopeptide (TPR) repeat protein
LARSHTELALAYEANALRVPGKLKEARRTFDQANRLAETGSDPYGLLDPGRLPDLEASLCRAERDFGKALRRLDEAIARGRFPARALIKKGFTLEVMGDYERAVEALQEAGARLDRQTEPRLWYKQRAQLAATLVHLGKHSEAVDLVEQARPVAMELGDEIDLVRLTWVEGRIQAGLGRHPAARDLLEQALSKFAKKGMVYDVLLAALEIAGLLLDEGKTAEVKALTLELAEAFESEDVHHEARKALELFREAAEREAATAELARQVLSFLFRARHDPGLRFA